jgi:hypothetical protein
LSKLRWRKSGAGQYAVVEAPASARVEVQEVRILGAQGGTSSAAAFNGAQRSTVCSREREPTAFISVREAVGAFLRVKEGKSRHGHKAVWPRQPMVACGRRGRPMADGGAAARHTRVRRVASANGPASITHRKHGVSHGPLDMVEPRRAGPAEPRRGRALWSARASSPIQPSPV